MECAVAVDDRAVLAAQRHHVAGLGGLGDGLAVHAGAVVGLGGDVPVRVQDLDGGAGVLGALRGEQAAAGQRHRDPVVGVVGRGLLEHVELTVGEGRRVDQGDRAGAVGEDRGASVVGDDVAGVGRLDGEVGERGGLHVVVEVVTVALGEQTGVVEGDGLARADGDVAAVAGGVQARVAVELAGAEHRAVGRVDRGDAAVVGEHDPRGERADLGAVRGGGLGGSARGARRPAVGRAARGGLWGAAGREGEDAEARDHRRPALADTHSHIGHAPEVISRCA